MSDLRIYRNVFQSLTNLLLSNLREQSAHFSLYQRKNTEVFCKQHSCQTSRPYWMTDIHCPMKIKLTEATSHLIGPFLSAYGDIIHFKHETCKSSVISLTVTSLVSPPTLPPLMRNLIMLRVLSLSFIIMAPYPVANMYPFRRSHLIFWLKFTDKFLRTDWCSCIRWVQIFSNNNNNLRW